MDILRSPFFYVGDKYKLMPQLKKLFPEDIATYYEPFCGGGSSFLNTEAKKYIVNDIDFYVVNLHKYFKEKCSDEIGLTNELYKIIEDYNLSCSYKGHTAPDELKKEFVKTYYAKYNKTAYLNLRKDFNNDKSDMRKLYLLLVYGFNHMLRFNSKGDFNLPVGNVDYNSNVAKAISGYLEFLRTEDIIFCNKDYKDFLNSQNFNDKDFVFCDPPYLISQSEYNKIWNEEKELELYNTLDELNSRGVKFGLTNLIRHKGKENTILIEWMKKYNCYDINSNYISFNDNTIKANSKEVYVTNGCSKKETIII